MYSSIKVEWITIVALTNEISVFKVVCHYSFTVQLAMKVYELLQFASWLPSEGFCITKCFAVYSCQ